MNEGEIKVYSDDDKLREFVTGRSAWKELLKDILQTREK